MVFNAATNSNNNDTLVMPMSSSAQPPSGRYVDHTQDPLEDLTKSFSKKQIGKALGSKNKPKTCTVIEEDTQNFIEWVGLEILIREDIVVNIIKYDQQLQHNIIVWGGFVLISNVTILDPVSRDPLLPIEGPIHMTYLFGTYINPNFPYSPSQFISHPPRSSFTSADMLFSP
ncbi:hypothetical protein RYX36_011099 [Vicia faba]